MRMMRDEAHDTRCSDVDECAVYFRRLGSACLPIGHRPFVNRIPTSGQLIEHQCVRLDGRRSFGEV